VEHVIPFQQSTNSDERKKTFELLEKILNGLAAGFRTELTRQTATLFLPILLLVLNIEALDRVPYSRCTALSRAPPESVYTPAAWHLRTFGPLNSGIMSLYPDSHYAFVNSFLFAHKSFRVRSEEHTSELQS